MRPQLTPEPAAFYAAEAVLRSPAPVPHGARKLQLTVSGTSDLAATHITLQSAFDAVAAQAETGTTPLDITITLAPGTHAGPAILALSQTAAPVHLTISGAGKTATRLVAPIHARLSGEAYKKRFGPLFQSSPTPIRTIFNRITDSENIGTGNSAVLRITAPNVTLRDLSVINSYNCDRTGATPPEPGALRNADGQWSDETHQAVALMLEDADGARCENLHLESFQDTLYLTQSPGRHARYGFTACTITGDIDFIFGPATAHFDRCEIRSRATRSPNSWATAPSTPIEQDYGFVFDRCAFTHDGAVPAGRFRFGRQWFTGVRLTPYGTPPDPATACRLGAVNHYDPPHGTVTAETLKAVGKCVILNSQIGSHIDPENPWDDWKGVEFRADGSYDARDWSPAYRPAQFTTGDVARNLAGWADADRFRPKLPENPILLAEFHNQSV